MPRKPREEEAGAIHHVFARGNNRRAIFLDDVDRRMYLSMLERVTIRQGWLLLAYCLMDNHVHHLVETPDPNLGDGMRRLHGEYAQAHNARHGACGHLFQSRFGAKRVTSDEQLWVVAAYIARNPVEAGRCARAEDWPWSSHTALLEGREPPWLGGGRLLELFAAAGGEGRRRYAEMVAG